MYIEEVIDIEIKAGTTGATISNATTNLDESIVVGCVIFHDDRIKLAEYNPSMIMASLQVGGIDVSKMQHISNYRSREASYPDGFKPIRPFQSGKNVRFEIRAKSVFKENFNAQLVLIKDGKNNY